MKSSLVYVLVYDSRASHKSADPDHSELLVKSIRLFDKDSDIRCGCPDKTPPWASKYKVDCYTFKAPHEELRYANKIECIYTTCDSSRDEILLFLDNDVLMCNPLPLDVISPRDCIAGVHMDYPSEPTREGFARPIFQTCGVEFPKKWVPCTMYGGPTYPIINSGVLFINSGIAKTLCSTWLDFFYLLVDKHPKGFPIGYLEQVTLMPAILANSYLYKLLPVQYNWNGCIEKSKKDVVFLHYHRDDILETDHLASITIKAMNNNYAKDNT